MDPTLWPVDVKAFVDELADGAGLLRAIVPPVLLLGRTPTNGRQNGAHGLAILGKLLNLRKTWRNPLAAVQKLMAPCRLLRVNFHTATTET